MSDQYDYSSIILKPFERLHRIPSLMCIFGGLSILALTGLSVWTNIHFLKAVWATRLEDIQFALGLGDMTDTVRWAYLVSTILFVSPLFWSVKLGGIAIYRLLRRGIYDLRKPVYLGNIPKDLCDGTRSSKKKLSQALKKRTLSIYQPLAADSDADKELGRFLTILFGRRTGMAGPQERKVILSLGSRLKTHFKYLVVLGALLIGLVWFMRWVQHIDIHAYLDSAYAIELSRLLFGDLSLKWLTIAVAAASFVMMLILSIELTAIYILLPKKPLSTECHEDSVFFEGFGHPAMVLYRLPDWCEALRLEMLYPNRIYEKDIRFRKDHPVTESGLFKGKIFIEQQPHYVSSANGPLALLLLVLGWLLVASGYGVLFLPDHYYSMLKQGVQVWEHLLGAPLLMIALAFLIRFCISNGMHFIDKAYHLYDTFYFRSTGLMVEIEGYMSQADIKIGKALSDSISGERMVVSSDFNVGLWSAEMTSQCKGIRGERYLTSFGKSEESSAWLSLARSEITNMHTSGIKAIPISMRNPVIDIVDANLEISKLKHRGRKGNGEDLVPKETEPHPKLTSGEEEPE